MGYMDAVKALYGDCSKEELAKVAKKRKPRKSSLMASETYEQILLSAWLTKANILHYHIPNGGYRHRLEAYQLKRAGVKAGCPDICLPIARGGKHGLYIELKRKAGGSLSHAQHWWLDQLTKEGYLAICCHGFDEAKTAIESYLNNK